MDKIKKGDPETQSEDLVSSNISKLKELFPEVVTEGKIDFTALQEIMGEEVETGDEYYRFTWAGKAQARREAHKPSTGTLRPCKEESVDWDSTQNIYIEGDNLEVLKLLQKSYAGKVKMIYIDPPYNTGKDFVYKDNYKDNLKNYQELSGQLDSDGNKISTNSDSDGRYHSNWLNMIYPRLTLARNLLADDGVIFISIDDHEVENLMKIGNEIFGEINLLGLLIQNKLNSKNDTVNIQRNHEYIVAYRKKTEFITNTKIKPSLINRSWKEKLVYEENGTYYFLNDPITTRGEGGTLNKRHNLGYTIYFNPLTKDFFPAEDYDKELAKTSNEEDRVYLTIQEHLDKGFVTVRPPLVRGKLGCWTWSFDKVKNEKKNLIVTGKSGSYTLRKRTFISKDEVIEENGKLMHRYHSESNSRSILEFSTNEGTTVLNELMGFQGAFDNPKNISMLHYLTNLISDKDFIVLDFFSGSASSAHAVLESNSFDKGNRKFIQVQLPHQLKDGHEAKNHGYINICQLGKERIRRAAKKIAEENPDKAKDLDLGFKVFKLDTSNINAWDGSPEKLEQELFDSVSNIKTDRSEDDVLYEILLKYGLDLTLPIDTKEVAGSEVYSVGYGALFICLADRIVKDISEGIGVWKETLNPEICRVVFKDSGFNSDADKSNAVQTLKRFGITEIKSI